KVDPDHSRMDDGHMVAFDLRHFSRDALGLCGAGLGRLLGLGPGGERQLYAVAYRHRISAFGHDAGKEGHDEKLERVADLFHVSADYTWHDTDARWSGEFRARLRAIVDRELVYHLHGHRAG